MRVLVCYDVSTETSGGARRLRRVARACLDFGQRVQKSVFECVVTDAQYEVFLRRLLAEIDPQADSLRVYRLPTGLREPAEVYGVSRNVDFDGPLVI
jgi:CRISPR-associated protein Cas2